MKKSNAPIVTYYKKLLLPAKKTTNVERILYYLDEKTIEQRENHLKALFREKYSSIISRNPSLIGMLPQSIDNKIMILMNSFNQTQETIIEALLSYPTALNLSKQEIEIRSQYSSFQNTFMENFKILTMNWKDLDKKNFPKNFDESFYNDLNSSIQGHASKPENLFPKYLLLRLFFSHNEIISKKHAFTQSLELLYAKTCFLIENEIDIPSRLFIKNAMFEKRCGISKEELLKKYPISSEKIKKLEEIIYYDNKNQFYTGNAINSRKDISKIISSNDSRIKN